MQEHYSAFILSYMILSLASLSFVHAQIIRAWVICMKPCCTQISTYKMFWREPDLTTARYQRALWAASIGSIGLFFVLSGLTIIACIKPKLHTQIARYVQCLVHHDTLLTCYIAPNYYSKPKKGGSLILHFPSPRTQDEYLTFAWTRLTIRREYTHTIH